MHKLNIIVLLICATSATLYGQNGGYADLVEKVQNAVAQIETTRENPERVNSRSPFDVFRERGVPDSRRPLPRGTGSGFVISPDGYIVTNRHVVEDARTVTVNLVDGRTMTADVVGTDDSLDIALVKIDAENLTYFEIGDSKKMRIGDTVLAMGYPLGLGFSVTTGIVSGIGRNMRAGSMDIGTYIQSDADISFGNSGGPLVNYKGEVIGVNTLIVTQGETFGFAIPSEHFMSSVEQLKEYGRVRRGALGIQVGNLSEEARDYYGIGHGALVTGVYDGFPAAEAGISREDVILEVDGKKVDDSNEVVSLIAAKKPGDSLKLKLLSDGREVNRRVTLADRGDFGNNNSRQERERPEVIEETGLGLSMLPLDRRTRATMGIEGDIDGVLVHTVEPGSMAERKGVRPGSIITHINDRAIDSAEDVRKLLGRLDRGEAVQVRLVELRPDFGGYEEVRRTVFLRKS
jgi:serine protease Do